MTAVSDGRWYLAGEAQGLGLVDEIGTLGDVLGYIRSQVKEAAMPKVRLRPATAQAEDVSPEVVDETTTPEVTETESETTPAATPEQPQARGLADYMQAFGDAEGARMFLAGKPWEQAQADTMQALRGELQDAKAEVAQLKSRLAELAKSQLGETEPVQTGTEGRKKSFGEACRKK